MGSTAVETIKLTHIRRNRKRTERVALEDRLGPDVLKRLEAMAHEYVRFERGQFGFYIDPARYAVRQRQIGPMGRGRRRQVIAGVDKDGNVIKAWIGVDNRLERGGQGEFINIPMDFEKAALGGSDFGPGLGPGEGDGGGGGTGKRRRRKKNGGAGDDEDSDSDASTDDSESDSEEESGSSVSEDGKGGGKDEDVPEAPEAGPDEDTEAFAAYSGSAVDVKKPETSQEVLDRIAPPPPKPAGGPVNPKANERLGRQKKQLHWVKIPNNIIPGTLWQTKIDDSRVPVKVDELDELFGVDATPKFEMVQAEQKKEVLPHKRKHNINILLANLKMSAADILDVVRVPTYTAMETPTLQGLLVICPTPEEEAHLKENMNLKDEVDATDRFMFDLIAMPGLRGKMLCAVAAKTFNEEALDVIRDMDQYAMIPVEVMKSNKLARTMEVILAIGNVLNSGTNKGGAHGYKLEAFAALQTVKDCNGQNLQDYLVDYLEREYTGLLPLDDMPALPQSENLSLDAINENVQHLLESISTVNEQVKAIGTDPGLAKFREEMEKFLLDANKAREEIISLRGLMMKKLEEMMGYFGEKNKSARGRQEDVMRMLRTFVADLETTKKMYDEKKERELKVKKEDKKKKAAERKKKKGEATSGGKDADEMDGETIPPPSALKEPPTEDAPVEAPTDAPPTFESSPPAAESPAMVPSQATPVAVDGANE